MVSPWPLPYPKCSFRYTELHIPVLLVGIAGSPVLCSEIYHVGTRMYILEEATAHNMDELQGNGLLESGIG